MQIADRSAFGTVGDFSVGAGLAASERRAAVRVEIRDLSVVPDRDVIVSNVHIRDVFPHSQTNCSGFIDGIPCGQSF